MCKVLEQTALRTLKTVSSYSSSVPGPQLNILSAIGLWLLTTTGLFVYLIKVNNQNATNERNEIRYGIVTCLLFFNNLNILIALCEMALGKHIRLIQDDYQKLRLQYASSPGGSVQAAMAYLTMPLPWDRLADGKLWCRMWSTYALYDPSYQNSESLGFFLDVGNGWTTIPPCLLMNLAMSMPQWHFTTRVRSPLFVGCVCLASYWQILYGTIVYLVSFVWNQRYQGKSTAELVGFVGCTNGLWLVFPMMGISACVSILHTQDFSVFGYTATL